MRSSSVFPAPSRPALACSSYKEASRLNQQLTGRQPSRQGWAIAPKIREVDELLREDAEAHGLFREVHPELCLLLFAHRIA